MGLEFIDISRDEEIYCRPRTQGASNRRRAAGPERQSRAVTERRRQPEIEVPDFSRVKRYPREVDPRIEQERIRRRKRRKRKTMMVRMTSLVFLLSLIAFLLFVLVKLVADVLDGEEWVIPAVQTEFQEPEEVQSSDAYKPIITEDFISINEFSRPGEAIGGVNNIFVHYTANPGTSATQNRSYFENLGTTGETSASAHFVIGYDGEIIQCIPLDEIAYAVAGRNYDSISIECCYLSEDGAFTDTTYQSLIRLSAWLLKKYNLTPEDMRRHFDEGGKKCPLYFVEHEDAWEQFLTDLREYIIMKEQA